MAAPETKQVSSPVFTLDIATGVTCVPGDLLTWNNTADKLTAADADAIATFASFMALNHGNGDGQNSKIAVARRLKLTDADDPYTAEAQQYLHTTALAVTETRPTGEIDVRQVVGQAITAGEIEIDIKQPYEVTVPIQLIYATSADKILDSGNLGGPTFDASGEACLLNFTVPENAIALEIANLWIAAEDTGGTPTMDITIGSAISGAQHSAVTADATLVNQVREGSAADEVFKLDITLGLDATDIIRPGAIIGIKCLQDDGGTDISFIFGGYAVFLCV